MTTLEMDRPVVAGTNAGEGTEVDECERRMASTTPYASQRRGAGLLVLLTSWVLGVEHRWRERRISAGWDAALSLQLDRLTDILARLADYRDAERRRS